MTTDANGYTHAAAGTTGAGQFTGKVEPLAAAIALTAPDRTAYQAAAERERIAGEKVLAMATAGIAQHVHWDHPDARTLILDNHSEENYHFVDFAALEAVGATDDVRYDYSDDLGWTPLVDYVKALTLIPDAVTIGRYEDGTRAFAVNIDGVAGADVTQREWHNLTDDYWNASSELAEVGKKGTVAFLRDEYPDSVSVTLRQHEERGTHHLIADTVTLADGTTVQHGAYDSELEEFTQLLGRKIGDLIPHTDHISGETTYILNFPKEQ